MDLEHASRKSEGRRTRSRPGAVWLGLVLILLTSCQASPGGVLTTAAPPPPVPASTPPGAPVATRADLVGWWKSDGGLYDTWHIAQRHV